jgi:hypothetical protein
MRSLNQRLTTARLREVPGNDARVVMGALAAKKARTLISGRLDRKTGRHKHRYGALISPNAAV